MEKVCFEFGVEQSWRNKVEENERKYIVVSLH